MTLAETRIQALLQGILDHPEDDDRRLVYADALEDRDGPGDAERAEFIRVQIKAAALGECLRDFSLGLSCCCGFCVAGGLLLRRRERELLGIIRDATRFGFPDHRPAWSFYLSRHEDDFDDECTARLDRGFADKVTLNAADWLAHGDAIAAAHPIREVRLTDLSPFRIRGTYLAATWPEIRFELPWPSPLPDTLDAITEGP